MGLRTTSGLLVASAALALSGCSEPTHLESDWEAMGRRVEVEVYHRTAPAAEHALEEIRQAIDRTQAMTDFRCEDSALAELNRRSADEFYRVPDPELYRLIAKAQSYAEASDGAFDPTLAPLTRLYERGAGRLPSAAELEVVRPRVGWQKLALADEARGVRFRQPQMELDLGGIDKGLALDFAARAFVRPGSIAGLLRIGNNFYVWGQPPGAESWSLLLPDPRAPGASLGRLQVANRGIAVSGHALMATPAVFDAGTGGPASSDLLAAVAIADSAANADAIATALFVQGSRKGGQFLTRTRRVEAILLVEGNGEPYVLASATLAERLELSAALAEETEGRLRFILPPQTLEVGLP